MWDKEWIKGIDYPEWGDTEVYKKTIGGGYYIMGRILNKLMRGFAKLWLSN